MELVVAEAGHRRAIQDLIKDLRTPLTAQGVPLEDYLHAYKRRGCHGLNTVRVDVIELFRRLTAQCSSVVVGARQRIASPEPHAPLTEADGYRAWQLYTDITGHIPVSDPFDR